VTRVQKAALTLRKARGLKLNACWSDAFK
jgi:hypothetical protein